MEEAKEDDQGEQGEDDEEEAEEEAAEEKLIADLGFEFGCISKMFTTQAACQEWSPKHAWQLEWKTPQPEKFQVYTAKGLHRYKNIAVQLDCYTAVSLTLM